MAHLGGGEHEHGQGDEKGEQQEETASCEAAQEQLCDEGVHGAPANNSSASWKVLADGTLAAVLCTLLAVSFTADPTLRATSPILPLTKASAEPASTSLLLA